MFEKSLYDLIKGLRNHKGAEEEFIQGSLRECKTEIRSQDMDKKATALMKLVYLEMFGYDMSWASFHVLEVMSSTKYLQKRAGYLAAVQSFRADTEVLMLATNLLKKDLTSSNIPNLSLPLITLPNITTSSLAMSLLPDILSRISHPHAVVRKKALVCLYRLALVYPEALKLAWPKIKECMMNTEEDGSVTTAVINVVCELGWRRPHDFLPLAPRLFDLLVDGGNNWMAIKIIKLFAVLTPMEPRLIRKLIRPLMDIIQTTTAMSLLYECINGIIQGGILEGDGGFEERNEIATLCVEKLRGMIVGESDPNLKYVALLAFNRVAILYPMLVSVHQDIIMDCLKDADISIRLQSLELASRMVTSDTLQVMVNRLINQLKSSMQVFGDGEDAHEKLDAPFEEPVVQTDSDLYSSLSFMPDDYGHKVLHKILDMCSYNNYAELPDFDWYMAVLLDMVKILRSNSKQHAIQDVTYHDISIGHGHDISHRVGSEVRNIAVRVRGVRVKATRAAESVLLNHNRDSTPPHMSAASSGVLGPLAWVAGEYAEYLLFPREVLQLLMDTSSMSLPDPTISLYLQAIPKILMKLLVDDSGIWSSIRRSESIFLIGRVIEFLESLAAHPDLDVQERAIEFLEVIRLAADAIQSGNEKPDQIPFLLSSIIPTLFLGLELNPVAANAQKRVPLPEYLDLNGAFNNNLQRLFYGQHDEFPRYGIQTSLDEFYYNRSTWAADRQMNEPFQMNSEPQESSLDISVDDMAAFPKRKIERRGRNRDDPFYIDVGHTSDRAMAFDRTSRVAHENELDVESIPVIDLGLNDSEGPQSSTPAQTEIWRKSESHCRRYDIVADEMIGHEETPISEDAYNSKKKPTLLQVDSSGLGDLSLDGHNPDGLGAATRDDAEMAMAMQEMERLRLEMQRASERVHPDGIPAEGALVKKRKKKAKQHIDSKR